MKMLTKMAAAAAVATITAVSMAGPSQAASRYQVRSERGAIAADQAYGSDSYARQGASAYDYMPLSNPSELNEHQCMMSPGSQAYQPCANAGD